MHAAQHICDCTKCILHCNQAPLLDDLHHCDVMFVGLSAKKATQGEKPLDSTTLSGKLIENIVQNVREKDQTISFYRTNLVKCLPLTKENKLRYPTTQEKTACIDNLYHEIDYARPRIIFLLGRQVCDFVSTSFGMSSLTFPGSIDYYSYTRKTYHIVPVHHPSYIQVYKRSSVEKYKKQIIKLIMNIVDNKLES